MGLGNPGSKYEGTRHNIGFRVVSALADHLTQGAPSRLTPKFKGLFFDHRIPATAETPEINCKLLLPQTFMNLSGESVREAVHFFKLDPAESLLVVADDLDTPMGSLRLRLGGGSGGHNGLRSIIENLGTEQFPRLRMGIGRSPVVPAESYVLERFTAQEQEPMKEATELAVQGILKCFSVGIAMAMNSVNVKVRSQP